jgi:hypothetical protein
MMLMVISSVGKSFNLPSYLCLLNLMTLVSYINYIAWNGRTILNVKFKRNAERYGRGLC